MWSPAFITSLLLLLFCTGRTSLAQGEARGTIEGAVYDLYESVIVNVWISVENTRTGEIINLRTDDAGRYSTRVQEGRFRVTMRPSVGDPFFYEHASFSVSSNEKVTINFRPKPFSISDSIEGGHWRETYVGAFPSYATHFIQQRDGAIRDLRIQYQRSKTRSGGIEYQLSVTASFDRYTIYADKVFFDKQNGKLMAEGAVLFEDGSNARKVKRVEIDLSRSSFTAF
jgi:hypothetical protein